MKPADFDLFLTQFCQDMDRILSTKGVDYSTQEDRLANFKQAARDCGVSPRVAWYIYFNKHLTAIQRWVRDGHNSSEPLRGRFLDAVNYLVLGAALATEDWETVVNQTIKDSGPLPLMSGWEREAIARREADASKKL